MPGDHYLIIGIRSHFGSRRFAAAEPSHRFTMGSVPIDYVCPHCDGKGYGGYAPDGVGYPICTEGTANCLDKLLQGQHTRALVKRSALKMVLVIRQEGYQTTARATHILNMLSHHIAEFL